MRKLFVSAIFILTLTMVSAAPASQAELPEPGTTPASPFFGLERAQETVSLELTFNRQKKAEKKLRFAEERLAEARKLAEDNRSKKAENALQRHSRALRNANKTIERLPQQKRQEARKKMGQTRGKSLSVLEELKQRLPESAMKGINTAIQAHKGMNGVPAAKRNGTGNPGPQGQKPDVDKPDQRGNQTMDGEKPSSNQTGTEAPQGYVATGKVIKENSGSGE